MGKCTDGNCSITKNNTCCFECSAERFEECKGKECACEETNDGCTNRDNYTDCDYYNN